MKIYMASSWKTKPLVEVTADLLRNWGHEVDCFSDDSTGRFVFSALEEGMDGLNAIDFLSHKISQKAFREDKKWLDWAEVVVMVLPCGKSAHLEAGYAVGCGKPLFIMGEFPAGEYDVMYGFAEALIKFDNIAPLKEALTTAQQEAADERD